MEADETAQHVTVVETRAPCDGVDEWTRSPIARLRYTAKTGLWSLYWRDRNGAFHEYDRFPSTPRVADILDYLDSHRDPIFFG